MDKTKNKNSTLKQDLIVVILITLAMLAVTCFTLGGNNSVSSAWNTTPCKIDNTYRSFSVFVQIDGTVESIYVNYGSVYNLQDGKAIKLTFDCSNSIDDLKDGSSYSAFNRKNYTIEPTSDGAYRWQLLANKQSISSKFIRISTTDSFELCEIAFADKKGNQIVANYNGCYEMDGGLVFKEAGKESASSTSSHVADEQNSFDLNNGKFNSLTIKESDTLNAVNNLLANKGNYVSKHTDALGLELISLGVLIFGSNTFGLRFIPILFTLASLILAYFLGKKLFNSIWGGVALTVLYFVGGLCISLGGLGVPENIALFFIMCAYYFASDILTSRIKHNNMFASARRIILCGIFFALAMNVKTEAVYTLIGIAVIYLLRVIKDVKHYVEVYRQAEGLEKEVARENLVRVRRGTILLSIFAFIIIPILVTITSYGIAYRLYANYYNDGNLFALIFKNRAELLTAKGSDLFLGWFIGLGSEPAFDSVGANGALYAIFANKALVAISTASVLAVVTLYILRAIPSTAKKLSSNLTLNLDLYKNLFIVISLAFLCGLLICLFSVGANTYSQYVYCSIFAFAHIPLLWLILQNCVNRKLIKAVSIILSIVVAIFFIMGFVGFVQLDINQKVIPYIYGWML